MSEFTKAQMLEFLKQREGWEYQYEAETTDGVVPGYVFEHKESETGVWMPFHKGAFKPERIFMNITCTEGAEQAVREDCREFVEEQYKC